MENTQPTSEDSQIEKMSAPMTEHYRALGMAVLKSELLRVQGSLNNSKGFLGKLNRRKYQIIQNVIQEKELKKVMQRQL